MRHSMRVAPNIPVLLVSFAWWTGLAGAERTSEADRAFLGVQIAGGMCQPVSQTSDQPACIGGVSPGGAADRAGLRPGDRIVRIGPAAITGIVSLQTATQSLRVGQSIDVVIERGSEMFQVKLELGAADRASFAGPANAAAPLGIIPPIAAPRDACEDSRTAQAATQRLPYRKQSLALDKTSVARILGDAEAAAALDHDVLTLAFRATGGAARVVSGGLVCALEQVDGSGQWALQLKMPHWDRVFLTAHFMSFADSPNGANQSGLQPIATASATFRGSAAPAAPLAAQPLRGSLREEEIHSRNLGAPRKVSVYLPPGRTTRPLPVLYLADGQNTAPFAAIVDSLIASRKIARIAIVGVHAGRYTGDPSKPLDLRVDDRAREYLRSVDQPQFERHMRFFIEELLPWAQSVHGVSAQRRDRAVMGYSNGSAFVQTVGLTYPELFGTVLAFSPARRLSDGDELPDDPSRVPRFLFSGGELEPPFHQSALASYAWLNAHGVATAMKSYWSGHDAAQWEQALAEYLPEVFPLTPNS